MDHKEDAQLEIDSQEIGAETGPYGLACHIVKKYPNIKNVFLRRYGYKPLDGDNERPPDSLEKEKNEDQPVLRGDFLDPDFFNSYVESEPLEVQVGLCSKVEMEDGEIMHIPMTDMSILKNPENLKKAVERFWKKGIDNGWFLESGASYHYYGSKLLTPDQFFYDFMAKCFTSSIIRKRHDIVNIVDVRYLGHALRRRCACLRLTARADKTYEPRVVYAFDEDTYF
jgi:hypothetical protein